MSAAPQVAIAARGEKRQRRWNTGAVYHGLAGVACFFLLWYVFVDVLGLWRFAQLPKISKSFQEAFSFDPVYGVSVFTGEYYDHLFSSVERVAIAFLLAVSLGVAIGILSGWNRMFRAIVFPLLEISRPLPVLAWIPIVVLMAPSREFAVITLTFLAAFFITILNTLLGVRSIDDVYFRAAKSLGFSELQVLRHVIIPGAMPYVFVGLQIAMAACWFSLVASEIVAGTSGLGYKIWEAYYYVQFETMIVIMATLGLCGYISSALVRALGMKLMRWRGRMESGAAS
jgi:NitT/TauT family transport system permease protein